MVAPIDATATVEAGDEKIILTFNFRTIGLAKAEGVDLLAGDKVDLDAHAMVKVIAAFAKPAQPSFDDEQAFALVVRHGPACGEAVAKLMKTFSAAAPKAGSGAAGGRGPRKPKAEVI